MIQISYKYNQVYRNIKEKIQSQIYIANEYLPPENTLTTEHDVSRITIRKALSKLVDEGYVCSIPGKGYFVLPKNNDNYYIPIDPGTILKGIYNKVELLGSDIKKATIELVYHLRVHPDSRIVTIHWGLFRNQIPVAYDVHYIPYFTGINIWNNNFSYTSIGDIVRNQRSLDVTQEEIEISAVKCNSEIGGKLDIPVGSPVMLITKKIYSDDEPVGMGMFYIRKEYCKLVGETSNN